MDIFRKKQKQIDQLAKTIILQEEIDAFLIYLNKKIRNLNKKLDQIEDLEKLDELNADQQIKVSQKKGAFEELNNIQDMKIVYYQSHEKQINNTGTEYLKKKEDSEITKRCKGVQKVTIQSIMEILQVGRFVSERNQIPKSIGISELEEQKIFNFYDHFTMMNPQKINFEKNQKDYRKHCVDQLEDFMNHKSEEYLEIKKNIELIANHQSFQKIKMSELNEKIGQEVIQEKYEEEELYEKQAEEAPALTQKVISNSEIQNYDGDSEKSNKVSGSENQIDQNQKENQQQGNQYEKKKNGNNRPGQYKKKFYQVKQTYEDSDHYQRNQNDNYNNNNNNNNNNNQYDRRNNNKNPIRRNNNQYYNKDYDTDKEKDHGYKKKTDFKY